MPTASKSGARSKRAATLSSLAAVVVVAATLTACSSTSAQQPVSKAGSSTRPPIPAAAFSDHTGITPTSVTVGNISTETGGLFTGAVVGTKAYAAYVNSQGGVDGRKLVVNAADDGFAGAANKQLTQTAVQDDFATVGSFSLEDNFGGTVLAANPQVPNVSETLDPTTEALANTFNAVPSTSAWALGPLAYFKAKYPAEITHTANLTSTFPSALASWGREKSAMEHLGYKIAYYATVPVTQTDFTQNVIAMRNAGVQLLYIDQLPPNYASAVIQALNQQHFHPTLVIGTSAYSEKLVSSSGGAAAVDGAYLEQTASLFLGEDAQSIPAVATFLSWVQKVSPGFTPDFYTLDGWLSAELFTQALRAAGTDPSRGSVLAALRKITSFSGGNIIATTDPANRTPASCYVIARVVNGTFQRLDDPPVDGPTHGYRCDQPLFATPS